MRRTPGLRREEVAALAGVSIDYYTRLERGKETRPSPAVIDALARALKLDADEHEHLRALAARAARYAPEPRPPPAAPCGPSSSCCWRPCARTRPTSPAAPWTCSPPTPARWRSTPASGTGPPRSATSAASCSSTPPPATSTPTGITRSAAASPACAPWPAPIPTAPTWPPSSANSCSKAPTSPGCGNATTSPAAPPRQNKTFHHPQVGTITLGFQGMQLEGTPGQRLGVYVAEPGTPDYDAMILLDMTAPADAAKRGPGPGSPGAPSSSAQARQPSTS